jgi:large subunit ribosomal protein L35
MPKMKTKRAAAKRFSFTKNGKIKRGMAFHSHILTKKNRKRKRRLVGTGLLNERDKRKVQTMLPYR